MSGQMFEGKTVEEALQKAAAALGVEVADLEHEGAGDQGGDFWGLGEPAVSVRAWVRVADVPAAPPEIEAPQGAEAAGAEGSQTADPAAEPQVDEESVGESDADSGTAPASETSAFFAPAPAPARQAGIEPAARAASDPDPGAAAGRVDGGEPSAETAGASGEASGEQPAEGSLEEAAVDLLNRIFSAMEFDCSAEARVDDEALLIAISGDDNQYLLDGRGRGLSALELILNHAFRHRAGDEHKKIHVDAGDFRARREDEIRDLAYQVSHQAKETGTEQETQPLNPYERRIVHLTLADDEQVTTRSRGTGFMKSVSIIPTTSGRR